MSVHPRTKQQLAQQQELLQSTSHNQKGPGQGKKKKKNLLKSAGEGIIACFASVADPNSVANNQSGSVQIRPIAQDVQLTTNEPFDLRRPFTM